MWSVIQYSMFYRRASMMWHHVWWVSWLTCLSVYLQHSIFLSCHLFPSTYVFLLLVTVGKCHLPATGKMYSSHGWQKCWSIAVECLFTVWILIPLLSFVKHTSKLYFLNLIITEDWGPKYQLTIHQSPQCHISQGFKLHQHHCGENLQIHSLCITALKL